MKDELKAILFGGLMTLAPLVLFTLVLVIRNPYLKMGVFCLLCSVSVIIFLWICGRGKAFKERNNKIYQQASEEVKN